MELDFFVKLIRISIIIVKGKINLYLSKIVIDRCRRILLIPGSSKSAEHKFICKTQIK